MGEMIGNDMFRYLKEKGLIWKNTLYKNN
jgi:hypothetical protein